MVLVQFPCEIDRPSEVYLSRFTPNSAMLRPLKVEAGINGLLPTSWVPSHLFRFSLDQASLRAGEVPVFCVRQSCARSSLRLPYAKR
jgi:hypothetical protein